MTVFVKRIGRKKSLRTISHHDAGQDKQNQPENMSRHGVPASWASPSISSGWSRSPRCQNKLEQAYGIGLAVGYSLDSPFCQEGALIVLN
jgi:hypothetical protein